MQLSAANLLIAAQQLAKPAPQAPAAKAQFAAAPAGESRKEDTFAPLSFKQAASPAPARPATPSAAPRIGATVDIRV